MKKTSTLHPAQGAKLLSAPGAVRQTPRASTLARIRQFARAAAVISPALPPIVLN